MRRFFCAELFDGNTDLLLRPSQTIKPFSDYLDEYGVPFGDVIPLQEIEASRNEMGRIIGEIKKTTVKIRKGHGIESPPPPAQNYFLGFC